MQNQKLDQLLPEVLRSNQLSMQSTTQDYNELSVYTGDVAPTEQVVTEVKKLCAAFPNVTNDYLAILIDRLLANHFTTDRVRDAINHIIDTSPYQRPSVAEIVSFDRKVKLFSYKEVQTLCAPGYPAFDHFNRVEINGKIKYTEI